MERIGKDMLHFSYRGAPPGSPFGRAVTEGDGEGAAPCFPLSGLASLGRRSHREGQGGAVHAPVWLAGVLPSLAAQPFKKLLISPRIDKF